MTRANNLPTMLSREMPMLLLQLFLSPLFLYNGNNIGVPHAQRYSSFLPALARTSYSGRSNLVLQCLIKSGIAFYLHHQRLPTLPLEFIIVCKPPNCGCTLLNTSIEAHNVITHDLINRMIFCHDSKLCVSTIITFENSYYNELYTIIVKTGKYTECANVFYCWLYVGSNYAPNCVNV